MTYKKYDPAIKKMIADSGQPNLFPELKIPRTTALYWIEKSREVHASELKISDHQDFYMLRKEIFKLKAEREMLMKILSKVSDLKPLQSLLGMEKKEYIVKLIDDMRGIVPVIDALKLIKISSDKYYRWRAEVYGCEKSITPCNSNRPNQLTRQEQRTLVEMARDKKFAHMSIKSLMYYCQRHGILYCGYDSWLKYIKINEVKRFRIKRQKRKTFRVGIRARKPNEIWHIDITEIQIRGEQRFYLQMIVDNFSRAIISWNLSERKDLQRSLKTIKRSLRDGSLPEFLMSDGGRENVNQEVGKLLLGRGISQMIAKADVQFSNSMIEAVFKRMKGVIDFSRTRTLLGLKRRIGQFVSQYNFIVPHSKLEGALPFERHHQKFNSSDFLQHVRQKRVDLMLKRSVDYQRCSMCLGPS